MVEEANNFMAATIFPIGGWVPIEEFPNSFPMSAQLSEINCHRNRRRSV